MRPDHIGYDMPQRTAPTAASGEDRRIVVLDGLRGLMTGLVIVSHYFGELPHGIRATMSGWIAVEMFFVLSGLLIGKLILEKEHHANFFSVFYVRRFCRIIPPYVLTVLPLCLLLAALTVRWTDADVQFPLWSYLTFTQGFFMIGTDSIGAHWLAPTWTLAVEEHFYLVAPALIVFVPRRLLAPVLLGSVAVTVGLRAAVHYAHLASGMTALTLLPFRSDALACGLLAALAIKEGNVPWQRLMAPLRLTPVIALASAALLRLADERLFMVFGPLLVSIGCSAFLLAIVHGAPEARRFRSRALLFLGHNGYCLYLTHLPVLGLLHGLLLGSSPDLETPAQWLVTVAALPACLLVGWGMTKLIEEPFTRYGRTWRWSRHLRTVRAGTTVPSLR